MSGLDPELAKAIEHPQIRAAVEAEMHQAWEAEAQYEAQYKQAVDWANGISQQALVREFPELHS